MLSSAVVGVETPCGVTLTALVTMTVELGWSVMGFGLPACPPRLPVYSDPAVMYLL